MPVVNAFRHPIKPSTKEISNQVGTVFGFWLSGIFASSLVGNLLGAANKNLLTPHQQENSLNIALLLTAIVWPLLYFTFSKLRLKKLKLHIYGIFSIVIFLFFALISVFVSKAMITSFAYLALTIVSIWICLLFINSLDAQKLERGLKVYAFLITVQLVGFSIWEYIPGHRLGEGRRIIEPGTLGMIAMSGIFAAMAYRVKLFRYAVVVTLVIIIYLTLSRAPALGTLIGLATIYFERTRASGTSVKLFAIVILCISVIGVMIYLDEIWPFIDNFLALHDKHRGTDAGGSGRVTIWKETWDLFLNNPLFGVGYRVHESLLKIGSNSHNGYLALLVEIGVVGFLAAIYLIVSGIIRLRNILRQSAELVYTHSILLGVLFSYLFLAIFERFLINSGNPTSILFLIAILWPVVKSNRYF
jgi:O-antigen ligase